ncbi:MAG TPA: hypothetical protein VFX76_16575, partial [Roseiflexaceae bacterium]|nr:hypothetical protein [Roseiflexaceae bacterium]
MSFLSKLFRGGNSAPTEEAPDTEEQAPAAADEAVADAPSANQDEPAPEVPDAAASSAEPALDGTPAEETPWWAEEAAEETPAPVSAPATDTTATDELVSSESATEAQASHEAAVEATDSPRDNPTRPLDGADLPTPVMLRSSRGLAAAAQRDIGRVRSINQDSVFELLTTLPREGSDITLGLFVVADGM